MDGEESLFPVLRPGPLLGAGKALAVIDRAGVSPGEGPGEGIRCTQLMDDPHQACFRFPRGRALPLTLEFKFRKEGCETWESGASRTLSISVDPGRHRRGTYDIF